METFHAGIYRATSTFYEGELTSLVVPAVDGQYGVMAKHSDVVIAIVPGHMHFTLPDGRVVHAACSEGMMEVVDNRVMIPRNIRKKSMRLWPESRKLWREKPFYRERVGKNTIWRRQA